MDTQSGRIYEGEEYARRLLAEEMGEELDDHQAEFERRRAEGKIIELGGLHPSQVALLKFFEYSHLPDRLQTVSAPFAELAGRLAGLAAVGDVAADAELTTALRKLLEAKDCAVRAALGVTDDR